MSNGNSGAIPAANQATITRNNNDPAIIALQNQFRDIIKDLNTTRIGFIPDLAAKNQLFIESLTKVKQVEMLWAIFKLLNLFLESNNAELIYRTNNKQITGLKEPELGPKGLLTFYIDIDPENCKGLYPYTRLNCHPFELYLVYHPLGVVINHENCHACDALLHIDEILSGVNRNKEGQSEIIQQNFANYNKQYFIQRLQVFTKMITSEVKNLIPTISLMSLDPNEIKNYYDGSRFNEDVLKYLNPPDKMSPSQLKDLSKEIDHMKSIKNSKDFYSEIKSIASRFNKPDLLSKAKNVEKASAILDAFCAIYLAWNTFNYDDLKIVFPWTIKLDDHMKQILNRFDIDEYTFSEGHALSAYDKVFPNEALIYSFEEAKKFRFAFDGTPSEFQEYYHLILLGNGNIPIRFNHLGPINNQIHFFKAMTSKKHSDSFKKALSHWSYLFCEITVKSMIVVRKPSKLQLIWTAIKCRKVDIYIGTLYLSFCALAVIFGEDDQHF